MTSCLAWGFPGRAISWIMRPTSAIVNKSGAWYAYEGEKIGQGRENAKQFLREHPEICQEIETKVKDPL